MIGCGDNCKFIVYVENVVYFFVYFLELKECDCVFNYIDKFDFDVKLFVNLICKEIG